MKTSICVLAYLWLGTVALTAATQEDLSRKWLLANKAFQEAQQRADFLKVAARYEELVQDGVCNGYLFYNLGNSYLKSGRLGRAILNYRRAQYYLPQDPYLAHNLQYARRLRGSPLSSAASSGLLRHIFFWHYLFSEQVRIWCSLVCYFLFWLLLALRLWRFDWPYGLCLTLLAAVWLAMSASVAIEEIHLQHFPPAVLLDGPTVVRKGNGKQYQPLYDRPLPAGTEVRIVEQRADWTQVELPDNHRGWVPHDKVARVLP